MLSSFVTLLSVGAVFAGLGVQDVINREHIKSLERASELEPSTHWTVDFISKHGYPVETHQVTTEDGYILTLHRIPSSPSQGVENKVREPIFLHHGFLGCSADWIVLGPGSALGFDLADRGYDVWMANARGTTDSKQHVNLTSTERSYWDFSWHEVGFYDLPTEIDYILNVTGRTDLTYIGYSMGTTVFWVMGATKPQYIGKVSKMIALAPVAFFNNVDNALFRTVATLATNVDWVVNSLGTGEFLPTNSFMTWAAKTFCHDDAWTQALCKNVMFLLCGFDSTNINESLVATIFEYAPAGASTKEVLHFAQLIRDAKAFRRYDYGWTQNLLTYGHIEPTPYRLSGTACPVHMFVGPNDFLANEKDAKILAEGLPNVETFKVANRSDFNHVDFVFASDAYELIYEDIFRILETDQLPSSGGKEDTAD